MKITEKKINENEMNMVNGGVPYHSHGIDDIWLTKERTVGPLAKTVGPLEKTVGPLEK